MPKIAVKRVDVASAILVGSIFSIILFVLSYFVFLAIVANTEILDNNRHYLEFTDVRLFFLKVFFAGMLVFAFLGSMLGAIFSFGYNFFSLHVTGVKFDIEEVERKF